MSRASSLAEARLSKAAPMFAALGDPTRLRVVARLSSTGPQSITGLSEGANVSRQAIAKHLRSLSDAGLVRGTRRGRERIWELEPQGIASAHHWLDQISQQWDAALDRLRAMVENEA